MKICISPLAWLTTLASLIVLIVALVSCGSSESYSSGPPNRSNTPSAVNTSISSSSSSSSGTSAVLADATSTATLIPNATATADVPTSTPISEPTQSVQIVHNFSCVEQVYNEVIVPAYPGILTISFIQVTTGGNAVTDYVKIQAVQGISDTFQWTLFSAGETRTATITDSMPTAINFGVTVLASSKAVVNPDGSFGTLNFFAASICGSWASDGVPVT